MVVHVAQLRKRSSSLASLHCDQSGCRPCGDGNDEFAPWINLIFLLIERKVPDRQAFHGLHPGFFQGVNLGGTSWKGASLGPFWLMLEGLGWGPAPPRKSGFNNKGNQIVNKPLNKTTLLLGGGVATARFGVRFFLQMGC